MIELKNVSKWYGSFQVLNDCSTSINKGEVVVVCGPSGSGKSTLIKTINALEPFQKGEIYVNGTAVHDPKTDLPKLHSKVAQRDGRLVEMYSFVALVYFVLCCLLSWAARRLQRRVAIIR